MRGSATQEDLLRNQYRQAAKHWKPYGSKEAIVLVDEFSRTALEKAGFTGFVTLMELPRAQAPDREGVYVVLREADTVPVFVEQSIGGWFKGKDPTVKSEKLAQRWVSGARVVYIGKAGNLRRRLDQFRRFGAGQPIGHWGGRYIWQCDDVAAYLVAWLPTESPPREI